MLDADMTVTGELPPEPRLADCYHGMVGGSWEYQLPLLIRGSRRWAYAGVTHSYLVAEDGDGDYSEASCDLRIEDRRPGGWRPGKLEEDARLLEAELERNPSDARSSFYLAQTYENLDRTGDALREYGRRAVLEGWDQERFVAKLRRGRLLCDRNQPEGVTALLEAWNERPIRAEPLYSLARHCRQLGWNEAALLFARRAAAIPRPADRLFVEASVYSTWIPLEEGIAELRAGDVEKGRRILTALRETLAEPNKSWIDEMLEEMKERMPEPMPELELEEKFSEDLNRVVYLRPQTADDEVFHATFDGRYHVPPKMPPPERILDLGSNIGLTVAHYAVLWPRAKIVGVEMALDHVALALRNTDRPILPVAVGSEDGVGRFQHAGTWGTVHHLAADGNTVCDVWTIRKIVEVCFDGREIDFVKMDIEGEEWDLFAYPDWVPLVKHLLVELHGGEAEEMKARGLAELTEIGYDATVHEIHPHALWAVRRDG